jgi:hypothetical protein
MNLTNLVRNSLALGAVAGLGVLAACSSSSTPASGGGGGTDSGAAVDANKAPVDSGNAAVDSGTSTDSGGGVDANVETLYDMLGGHAAIRGLVSAAVNNILLDPVQASYFVNVGSPGHPTEDQLEECFTDLIGANIGGPETYTTATVPLVLDSGWTCRSLVDAHSFLDIPPAVFAQFVNIIAMTASNAGVTGTNLAKIGTLLGAVEGEVINAQEPDAYFTYPEAAAYIDAKPVTPG